MATGCIFSQKRGKYSGMKQTLKILQEIKGSENENVIKDQKEDNCR